MPTVPTLALGAFPHYTSSPAVAENQPGPAKRPNENRMSNESPFSLRRGLRELIRRYSRRAPGSKDVQETPGALSFSSLTSLSSLKTGEMPGTKTTKGRQGRRVCRQARG